MKIVAQHTPGGFQPTLEFWDLYEELESGEDYMVSVSKKQDAREIWRHRSFFKMLDICYKNSDVEHEMDFDTFRENVIIEAGYYHVIKRIKRIILEDDSGNPVLDQDGKPYFKREERKEKRAKSISFAKMGEAEFKKLVDRAKDALIKNYMPIDTTPEDIDRYIINYGFYN